MDSKIRTDERKRLYLAALGRGILCLFAAGIVGLNLGAAAGPGAALPMAIIAAAFAANSACVLLAWAGARARHVGAAQIGLDLAFITALVYSTGGAGSEFLLLYFGPILATAVAFSRTAATLSASLSTLGLLACAATYSLSAARPPLVSGIWLADYAGSAGALVSVLALQAVAFHLVAILASTLSLSVRRANIETEQILENMTDGVITVSRDCRIVYANSTARSMLAVPAGRRLVGAALAGFAPAAISESLARVLNSGRSETIEAELGPPGVPVQMVAFPVFGQKGALRGASVVIHDVTERRRLIEALRRAERLEAAATTVASIAHEIRNPVAAIRGGAQELRKASGLPRPDAALLDLIVRESDRLNRILTDFLNFARMSKPQVADFDLRRLVDEVAAQVAVPSGGVVPEVRVTGPSALHIRADSEQLRRAFLNIALNGIEATGGAGPVVFEITSSQSGITVNIRDAGPGFDGCLAERIFEPFFTTKTAGTGLGLPVARRIVEDHGGSILARRDGGGWTCFSVALPAAGAQPAKPVERPPAGVASGRAA